MGGPMEKNDAGPVYGKKPFFVSPVTFAVWVAQCQILWSIFMFKETGFMKPELTFTEQFWVWKKTADAKKETRRI